MTKKNVLAVLFSVIGSVFTAIAILIIIGIIAAVLIINHLKPDEPPVKRAQFQYKIEYEVYGERYEKSDIFECYYDDIVSAGGGLKRNWKRNWQNSNTFNTVRLVDIDDEYYIELDFPAAGYMMGDFKHYTYKGDLSEPLLNICYEANGVFVREDCEKQNILKSCDFKILYWYCDSPIIQVLED